MFNFFDNTPQPEKNKPSNKDKFSKFNAKPMKKQNVEGFEMMNGKLNGSEYMSNRMEMFDLETTKDSMKTGLESLVAMIPGTKENMEDMKKEKMGHKEMMGHKEKMGHKENMDVMGLFKETMGHKEEEEEKESMDIMGMVKDSLGMKEKKGDKKKKGNKKKKEAMTMFAKEGMGHNDDEEEIDDEDLLKELKDMEKDQEANMEEGMMNMTMDKNTQVFAGGITIIALLLLFKFMQKK